MRWVWVLLAGAVVVLATTSGVGGASGDSAPTPNTPAPTPNTLAPMVPPDAPDDSGVAVDANATYDPDEPVSVTVSGTQGNLYAVYLYDADGDRVRHERRLLQADSSKVAFGDLDAGSYRVVVVETNSGAQVMATFGVGDPYVRGVVPEVVVDQPADVVDIELALPNGTRRATVELAGAGGDYHVTATVVDENGDGVVALEWNTFYAGRDDVSLAASGPDTVENASRERDLDSFLPEGEYALTVTVDGERVDRGAIVVELEPLHTPRINVFEAPQTGSPESSFEQAVSSGTVEADEWMFVVVHTQGIFGSVTDVDDLRSVGPDQTVLTITPEDGGEPVRLTAADYVHIEEGRIVVGFGPGTDALEPGTSYDVLFRVSAAHPYRAGEVTTGVNLEVVEAGSEPDDVVVSVERIDAPERVDAGGVANFTISLRNRGQRTGFIPVSVTIGAKTVERNVTVPGNELTTVDVVVDTDGVLEGDRRYVVDVNGTRTTGSIVVGSKDDAPTLVAGDREEGGLPGFTVPATVAALAVAGLVARRRRTARK